MTATKKQRVPALRFPEFSGEWEEKKLGEVGEFLDGRRRPIKEAERQKMQGVYPYYGASGIIDYVNEYIFDEDIILLGEDGENIVSRNLPLAFKVTGKCWINNHAHVIKPKENFHIDFLTQSLERVSYIQYNTGTAQPKLNQEVCSKIPLLFPLFLEQQKIADFLSLVDERIRLLKEKKANLEVYKRGAMQQLFSQSLRFKDENGNDYPDWEEKKLGEVVSFLKGGLFSKSDISEDGKELCIHYGELFTKYNEIIYNIVSKTNVVNGVRSKKGDVLMPTSDVTPNGLAKASSLLLNDVILGGDMNILRPKENVISEFLSYQLNFNKKEIMKLVTGTTVKHIYASDIKYLDIFVPSLAEQQQIADILSSIDTKITLCSEQIAQAEVYKKGLLQKMFV